MTKLYQYRIWRQFECQWNQFKVTVCSPQNPMRQREKVPSYEYHHDHCHSQKNAVETIYIV